MSAPLKIALNGNSTGPNDPNFLHFKDEQTGILLPSCPGYPDWLPQLQLTLTGRLCFWNFPATILRSVCSNPAKTGTSQYLRDLKKVTASNLYPPVPAAVMGTNGSSNQYLWNSCGFYFPVDQSVSNLILSNLVNATYGTNMTSPSGNKNVTRESILASFTAPDSAFGPPKIGTNISLGAWDWIGMNIQFYIDRYLNIPYDLRSPLAYGKTWIQQFNVASQGGNLPQWLSVANFFAQNPPDPSTWDKVAGVIPGAILAVVGGVLAFVSAGAATPLLASVLGKVNSAVKSSSAADAQANAQAAYDSANASVNTAQISSDVSALNASSSSLSATGKSIFFYLLVAVVIILVVIYYKKK